MLKVFKIGMGDYANRSKDSALALCTEWILFHWVDEWVVVNILGAVLDHISYGLGDGFPLDCDTFPQHDVVVFQLAAHLGSIGIRHFLLL
jgi:hypothetical protein